MNHTSLIWLEGNGILENKEVIVTDDEIKSLQVGEIYYNSKWDLYIVCVKILVLYQAHFYIFWSNFTKKTQTIIVFPANYKDNLDKMIEEIKQDSIINAKRLVANHHLVDLYRYQEKIKFIQRQYNLKWL